MSSQRGCKRFKRGDESMQKATDISAGEEDVSAASSTDEQPTTARKAICRLLGFGDPYITRPPSGFAANT